MEPRQSVKVDSHGKAALMPDITPTQRRLGRVGSFLAHLAQVGSGPCSEAPSYGAGIVRSCGGARSSTLLNFFCRLFVALLHLSIGTSKAVVHQREEEPEERDHQGNLSALYFQTVFLSLGTYSVLSPAMIPK